MVAQSSQVEGEGGEETDVGFLHLVRWAGDLRGSSLVIWFAQALTSMASRGDEGLPCHQVHS